MNHNVPNPMARFRATKTAPFAAPPVPTFAGVSAGAGAPAVERPRRRSKRFWIVLSLVAVVALLLSNCAGRLSGGSAFDAEQELEVVTEQLSAALLAQERAETKVDDLEREVRELEPQAGEVETLLASLEDERATIVTLQQERDAALAAVAELESRIAELESDAAAAVAAPQPQPAAQPAPVAQPVPAAAPYYDNCSDARAAGAAPLRVGSPGYRSGLDRDGDGVACES